MTLDWKKVDDLAQTPNSLAVVCRLSETHTYCDTVAEESNASDFYMITFMTKFEE